MAEVVHDHVLCDKIGGSDWEANYDCRYFCITAAVMVIIYDSGDDSFNTAASAVVVAAAVAVAAAAAAVLVVVLVMLVLVLECTLMILQRCYLSSLYPTPYYLQVLVSV